MAGPYGITELNALSTADLAGVAAALGLQVDTALSKSDLIFRLLEAQARRDGYLLATGVFEAVGEVGYGFLRRRDANFDQTDVYVSTSQVAALGLRAGDVVTAAVRVPMEDERYYSLVRIESINGLDPELAKRRSE